MLLMMNIFLVAYAAIILNPLNATDTKNEQTVARAAHVVSIQVSACPQKTTIYIKSDCSGSIDQMHGKFHVTTPFSPKSLQNFYRQTHGKNSPDLNSSKTPPLEMIEELQAFPLFLDQGGTVPTK